jgi:hypothetical protein
MNKHPLTLSVRVLAVALMTLAVSVAHVSAFTETKIKPPAGQIAPEAPAANLNVETENGGSTGLTLTTPGNGTGETELNIPGVGTIGKIPKLDFGLELLYGNGAQEAPGVEADNRQDDVLIQGKIRHRF